MEITNKYSRQRRNRTPEARTAGNPYLRNEPNSGLNPARRAPPRQPGDLANVLCVPDRVPDQQPQALLTVAAPDERTHGRDCSRVRESPKCEDHHIIAADLLDRVVRLTRDAGFQEEKYETLYLPIEWTKESLTGFLNARIDKLVKRATPPPLLHTLICCPRTSTSDRALITFFSGRSCGSETPFCSSTCASLKRRTIHGSGCKLEVEPGVSPDTVRILEQHGHTVEPHGDSALLDAIVVSDGWRQGAADGRVADSKATGY
jgi:hypothetical protein